MRGEGEELNFRIAISSEVEVQYPFFCLALSWAGTQDLSALVQNMMFFFRNSASTWYYPIRPPDLPY